MIEDPKGRLWLYHEGREPELITATSEPEILTYVQTLLGRPATALKVRPNGYCVDWDPQNVVKWQVDGEFVGQTKALSLHSLHDIARDLVQRYPTSTINIYHGPDGQDVYRVQ
jgi:hypothetical protein